MDDSEEPAESAAVRTISVKRKVLIAWISAAAVAAAAITGTTEYLVMQGDISRLQHAVRKLETEKAAALKQHDELRLSYGQMLAKQRCDVIDGLDDCLAAGLTRPQRFADTDRELIEARRAQELQRIAQEAARNAKPETIRPETKTEAKPETKPDTTQSAQSPSKKISMGEFLEEIKKIPGVGIEPIQQERAAGDKKDKIRR